MRAGKVRGRRSGRQERHGKAFFTFYGLVFLDVGVGGGIVAAADSYVAGVAVILISIPMARLCFSAVLLDLKALCGIAVKPSPNVSRR